MSNGATNIDDLPTQPSSSIQTGPNVNVNQSFLGQSNINNTNNNIKLELSDKSINTVKEQPFPERQNPQYISQQQHQQSSSSNNANDMNQFISSIQKASQEGALALPQRDIPTSQNHITQDQQIQANYIPSHLSNGDYINQYQPISKDEMLRRASITTHTQDDFYNDLQFPLLIFILYFIFNLPFVRKNIFTYLPVFFNKDGNLTGGGHLFHGIVFSVICFGVFKGFKYLSS